MTPTVSVKPGFGRRTEIPKNLTVKNSSSGGKNVTATSSSLKSSATQTISTSTLSNECRTRAASTSSSNFVPGQRPIEFTRDRTTTIEHGYFAAAGGKYKLESDMGMTKRSTERLLKQQAQMQQQQQMAMLNQMNAMYGNHNVQTKTSWSDVITLVTTGLSSLFGGSGAEKGGKTETAKTISGNELVAHMQQANNVHDLTGAIETATNQLEALRSDNNSLDQHINHLYEDRTNLAQTRDKAEAALSENTTAIGQKNSEVLNNQQRETASQMAMNAAQSQVDLLESQLSSAGPMAKAGIEASLAQAKEQLQLKKDQYQQAVEAREQSQADLKALQDATPDLKDAFNTAKAAYQEKDAEIKDYQNQTVNNAKQMEELNAGIQEAKARLGELQKQEGNDKKA